MNRESKLALPVLALLISTAWAGSVIFQDDFDDAALDPAKWFLGVACEDPPWSPLGNSVTESGGFVRIAQATTDHGGRLISTPIPVNADGLITVERRMRVHHTNDKFRAFQAIRGDNYSDWDANYFSRINYWDYNRTSYYYYGFGSSNDAYNFDPIWDTWFDEVWTYDPVTGVTSYSINGQSPLSWNGAVLDESAIRLDYCAEGWYSGHYIDMDYVIVSQGSAPPISPFDADTEGWLVVGLSGGYGLPAGGGAVPGWGPTDGNPGGGISATDLYAETFFSAPPKYLGNQAAAFGNTLSFDIKISYTDNAAYPAVVLKGATKSLYHNLPSTAIGVWTTRTIPLTGAGWQLNSWTGPAVSDADMVEVLHTLEGLYINAEWKTGSDLTYLDNVILTTTVAPLCGDAGHPYPSGDVSQDCYTNLTDLLLFARQWLRDDCDSPNSWCNGADLTTDHDVDLADVALITHGWLTCTDPYPPCGYMP